jgi:hypothetical protein
MINEIKRLKGIGKFYDYAAKGRVAMPGDRRALRQPRPAGSCFQAAALRRHGSCRAQQRWAGRRAEEPSARAERCSALQAVQRLTALRLKYRRSESHHLLLLRI